MYISAPSRAKVFGVETSPAELAAVLEKCRDHRQNVQQLLLKQEYQRSQAAMRQKMLENLDDSIKGQKSKVRVVKHLYNCLESRKVLGDL